MADKLTTKDQQESIDQIGMLLRRMKREKK